MNGVGVFALLAGLAAIPVASAAQGASVGLPAVDLAGAWSGTITHDGETTPFGLELEPAAEGQLTLNATIPAMHLVHQAMGTVTPKVERGEVRLGPFSFAYDAAAQTLTGVVPEALAPVYRIPLVLRRVPGIAAPGRAEPGGRAVLPVWTFEAGSPLWAGPTFSGGVVYVGGEDGQVHAVEAASGRRRWSFRAGGAIRTRPTVSDGAVYVQADDGFLYKLAAARGEERWRVKVVEKPIERLPFDDPKSRYDRFGSDVTASGGRLYLGTHDGNVLALDPASGARAWSFATGDAVLAAPAVDSGRVYAGSFDKHVYALDAATGRLALEARHPGGRRLDAGGGGRPDRGRQPRVRRARASTRRPATWPGSATSGSRGSSRRPWCATGWRTWARPTRPASSRSTWRPAGACGPPTSSAGPGASRP